MLTNSETNMSYGAIALVDILDKLRGIRNDAAHGIDFNHKNAGVYDRLNNLVSLVSKKECYALTCKKFKITPSKGDEKITATLLSIIALLEAISSSITGTTGVDVFLEATSR